MVNVDKFEYETNQKIIFASHSESEIALKDELIVAFFSF